MGNHAVGAMFECAIITLTDVEIDNLSQERAMDMLKKIGDFISENESSDAEFDDRLHPNQRLGRFLIKCFIPERYNEWKDLPYVNEEIDEEWYNKLYRPFREMFGFC